MRRSINDDVVRALYKVTTFPRGEQDVAGRLGAAGLDDPQQLELDRETRGAYNSVGAGHSRCRDGLAFCSRATPR